MSASLAARPSLDLPPTTKEVERLAEWMLIREGLTADDLLVGADALAEIIREAPSHTDLKRLRFLLRRLRLRAAVQARATPGKAEAEAFLRACPASASTLRMWQSTMPISCPAWGVRALMDALIAAADEIEQQPARPA
nr:hypothetical protein [uncultured Roseococcus sp.]